jgi:hypothetical protein
MLERAAGPERPRHGLRDHVGGIVAMIAGLGALVSAAIMQFGTRREITEPPDWRVTVPLLVVAIAATSYSFLRREPHRPLAIAGVTMAAVAVALGWVLVAAAVGAGVVLACAIIAKFM